jgi:hypothetical protein
MRTKSKAFSSGKIQFIKITYIREEIKKEGTRTGGKTEPSYCSREVETVDKDNGTPG